MSMFHVYILFLHNFDQIKIVHRVDHIIILSIFFLFERAFFGRCLRCALKRPLLCPACMHYYMCAVALILFDLDTHSTHSSWQSNYHRTLYSINKVRVRCSEANKYTHQTCSHGKWYEFSYCHITYRFIRNLCFFSSSSSIFCPCTLSYHWSHTENGMLCCVSNSCTTTSAHHHSSSTQRRLHAAKLNNMNGFI